MRPRPAAARRFLLAALFGGALALAARVVPGSPWGGAAADELFASISDVADPEVDDTLDGLLHGPTRHSPSDDDEDWAEALDLLGDPGPAAAWVDRPPLAAHPEPARPMKMPRLAGPEAVPRVRAGLSPISSAGGIDHFVHSLSRGPGGSPRRLKGIKRPPSDGINHFAHSPASPFGQPLRANLARAGVPGVVEAPRFHPLPPQAAGGTARGEVGVAWEAAEPQQDAVEILCFAPHGDIAAGRARRLWEREIDASCPTFKPLPLTGKVTFPSTTGEGDVTTKAAVTAVKGWRTWYARSFAYDSANSRRCLDLFHRLTQAILIESELAMLPDNGCPNMQLYILSEQLSPERWPEISMMQRFRDFSAEVRRIPESKLPLVNRSKCVDLAFEVARTLMSAQESRQLDMSVARRFEFVPTPGAVQASRAEAVSLFNLGASGFRIQEVAGEVSRMHSASEPIDSEAMSKARTGLQQLLKDQGCPAFEAKAMVAATLPADLAPGRRATILGPDGDIAVPVSEHLPASRLVYATYCVPELSGKNTRYVLNRMMYQMGRNARLKPDKFRNKRHFKVCFEVLSAFLSTFDGLDRGEEWEPGEELEH